ncbi:hypothetical protein HZC53_04940 [Candidatus Uhrbacteria bacterium]|nr:hypothetical protein [Candidatus Uhrbacteria bacterium]
MAFKMLIIDDEIPERKGYGQIEGRYPGVFEIETVRCYVSAEGERSACELLLSRAFDLILLDFSFNCQDEQGFLIAIKIRKEAGPNQSAYLVGTSMSWDSVLVGAIARTLRKVPGSRALDGWTGKERDNARGLFEELDKFLVSQGVDPAEVSRK